MDNHISTFQGVGYFSIAIVTLVLLAMLVSEIFNDVYIQIGIIILVLVWPITILIGILWLCSFVMSITGKTYTDRKLRMWHICDIIILIIIVLVNTLSYRCDADIMAKHYEKYGDSMRELIADTKALLPDSVGLHVEFDMNMFEDMDKTPYLNESQTKELKKRLKYNKCIGIDINRLRGYSTIRFRRIQWGMYSFRFYDRPLTKDEQEDINLNDPYSIVYNDSVAFEYGGGVFGPEYFQDKKDYLSRHKR